MEIHLLKNQDNSTIIDSVVSILKNGGIGIFPTDTVYGVGCDCLNIDAINKLYVSKKREFKKPINILVSNINMVDKFVKNINPIEQKLIEYFWPGALTIIFDKTNLVSSLLTSNLPTVGIRMPNNKICLYLIEKYGSPLATTSANLSDETPALSISDKLKQDFNNSVDFIMDSGELNGKPSTIVRVENNEIIILRTGSITKSDIQKCFGGNINVR